MPTEPRSSGAVARAARQDALQTRPFEPIAAPTEQLDALERLLSLCEVQSIRSGMPFPLGACARANGVNFAIFSRHASGVRLDLFDHSADSVPSRSILLDSVRNKTGDIWHVWLEGIKAGQFYGFRFAGPYSPHEGHRFNADKLVVDPYATAISLVAGCDFSRPLAMMHPLRRRTSHSLRSMMRQLRRSASSPTPTSTGSAINRSAMPGDQPLSMNSMCGVTPLMRAPEFHSQGRIAAWSRR